MNPLEELVSAAKKDNYDQERGRMSDELKPCPFCGSPGILERLGGPGSTHHIAKCSKCRCDLHFYPTREQAIEIWNRRADELLKGKP